MALEDVRWASTGVNLSDGSPNKEPPGADLKDVGFDVSQKPTAQEENYWRNAVYEMIQSLESTAVTGFSGAYPVGSVYVNASDGTDPATLLGFGTWARIGQGRVLVSEGTGLDDNNDSQTFNIGDQGGEYEHTLTVDEMPAHTHTDIGQQVGDADGSPGGQGYSGSHSTGSAGGSQAHNNVQPYLTVYMWTRVS